MTATRFASPLWRDFRESPLNFKMVYPSGTVNEQGQAADLTKVASQVTGQWQSDQAKQIRKVLSQNLYQEQMLWGASEQSIGNAKKLGDSDSLVVITGQQPGLLGGPALVAYKAYTAIHLAKQWQAELGIPVIPVFWIASDDSDLKEANHAVHPRTGQRLSLPFPLSNQQIPMGDRELPPMATDWLLPFLDDTEWQQTLQSWHHEPRASFTSVLRRLLYALYGDQGLVVIDAHAPWVHQLEQPVLHRFLSEYDLVDKAIRQGLQQYESLGHTQSVSLPTTALPRVFQLREGVRTRDIDPNSMDFLLHDVLSRPIANSHLLPILGHVLGPAELSYFGMLAPLFSMLELPFPILAQRANAVLLDNDCFSAAQLLGMEPNVLPALPWSHWMQAWWMQQKSQRPFLGTSPLLMNPEWNLALQETDIPEKWKQHLQKKARKTLLKQSGQEKVLARAWCWLGQGIAQERRLSLGLAFDAISQNLHKIDPFSGQIQIITMDC